jgi:hypothetical protein
VPRTCTICSHPQRQAIDKAIVAGTPLATIATQYHVIDESLRRHRDSHLPQTLVKAAEAEDVRQAIDVLAQLKAINGAALKILADAHRQGDGELALKAIDRIHRQLELQAKLLGELDDRPQVNVLVMPEWLAVRGALLAALAPYVEARMAVATALARLEEGRG